jgi:hypothetical protein
MTRHRTITAFVAVGLLAVAATAATMKSHAPEGIVVATSTAMQKADANELPTASFDERWSAMSASTSDTPER